MKTSTVSFLALLLMASGSHAATHTWQGSAASTLWSHGPNWTSGVAPAAGEANVKLIFPVTTFLNSVNSIPGLVVDEVTITGGNYTFSGLGGGSLTFTSSSAIALTNSPPAGLTNTFESTFPIAL